MKRSAKAETPIQHSNAQLTTIGQSPVTSDRLKQTNNHFIVNAINIASLAVLTSVGVNYILDQYKEKKDTVLREEIKDRLN